MPRDFLTLADFRTPTLTIVCEPCGRYGRYNVKRLIAKHGADVKLTDLLPTLANCEKPRSVNMYDRCQARFEGFTPSHRGPSSDPKSEEVAIPL